MRIEQELVADFFVPDTKAQWGKPTFPEYLARVRTEKEAIALGIFKLIAERFELMQASPPHRLWKGGPAVATDSGFSEEDLPSDLLGFYMGVREVSKQDVKDACHVLTAEQSRQVWDDTDGLAYYEAPWHSNHWKPKLHHTDAKWAKACCRSASKAWPRQFAEITPAPKGKLNWRFAGVAPEKGKWRYWSAAYDDDNKWEYTTKSFPRAEMKLIGVSGVTGRPITNPMWSSSDYD